MVKTQLNIRASEQVMDQISKLMVWTNETQTGIVTTAINRYFETERTKKMDITALTERVVRATTRIAADGIVGWGMGNPAPELFDTVEIRPASGCTSETCNHCSHDPAAAMIKLILKQDGQIINLGSERDSDGTTNWYAIISDDKTRYFRLTGNRSYWDRLIEIDPDAIPDWAFAKLAE